jgi:lipid-A-disaccharide synthase-like uncharacterized protein
MTEYLRTYWVFGLGFLAQSLFGVRIIIQWWITEKQRKVASPSLFWKFSLAGSALFLVYGILRIDIVIILGQLVAYTIYVRNLQLKGDWNKFSIITRGLLILIPISVLIWIGRMTQEVSFTETMVQDWNAFLFVGICGQLLLNIRFLYQLYYSEMRKESLLPTGFWSISLAGSILVVVYSVYRYDPVLMLAQGLAIVPYIRNIILSRHIKLTEDKKISNT